MKTHLLARTVPESLQVDLLLRVLRGERPAKAAQALGLGLRSARSIAESAKRGAIPAAAIARARRGEPLPEDPPVPLVSLELGRVSRAGILAPPLELGPLAFWALVDRSAGPLECWPWTGQKHEDGYGLWRTITAMRIAWGLVMGPIHPGLLVRHYACNNPPCCNPAHLRLGTHADNMDDRARARLRLERPELFPSRSLTPT